MPAKGRPTSVMIPIPFTPVKMAGAVSLGTLGNGVVLDPPIRFAGSSQSAKRWRAWGNQSALARSPIAKAPRRSSVDGRFRTLV